MKEQELFDKTEKYFGQTVKEFGVNYAGVRWNGEEAQKVRYDQLIKLVETKKSNFSICDYGCGYGYFLSYLKEYFLNWKGTYVGIDSSISMIEAAKSIYGENNKYFKFLHSTEINETYDYIISSGIFNLKMGISTSDFNLFMLNTIQKFDKNSKKGFAFNALTSYSDPDKKSEDLYYSDPLFLFDYCKQNFSNNVALLHDYKLYDFTIIVRKS